MDCRILEIEAKEGAITAAKYLCSDNGISTEGWWYFKEVSNKAFDEVQEADVIGWVMKEAGELIKATIERQEANLRAPKSVAPWMPQVFTPEI